MPNPPSPKDFLKNLPKVDLHCHLDGAVRPSTLHELAGSPGDFNSFRESVTVLKPAPLQTVLAAFHVITPLLKTAAALERAAFELVEDRAAEFTRHLEVRFAPTLHTAPGLSVDAVMQAVLNGLARGSRLHPISTGLVVCLLRGLPEKQNEEALEAAKHWFKRGVVGLDLADYGGDVPSSAFRSHIQEASAHGMPFTLHAGERPGRGDLETALEFGAARIGHGTHLLQYPDLLDEFIKRRILIEICLSSNRLTRLIPGAKDHPAKRLSEAGLPIAFCTDDPGLFGLTLTGELEIALRLGFTELDLIQSQKDADEALFQYEGTPA